MDKQQLTRLYQYFDIAHQVTQGALARLKDEELDYQPTPEMLSTRALLHHTYGVEKILAESVRAGGYKAAIQCAADAELATLTTIAATKNFGLNCHQILVDALAETAESELTTIIELPPGFFVASAPVWEFFAFAYHEHWHHRGQLTIYMRLLGKPVLDIYAYER
jgi:uncharacterized damage-inducible protein DinB